MSSDPLDVLFNKRTVSHRQPDDFYPTPEWLSDALIDTFDNSTRFSGDVWEPACGKGDLSHRLASKCPLASVCSSDLFNRGYGVTGLDFLSPSVRRTADWIITNPPFKLGFEFMLQAEKLSKKGYALLFPIRYLAGKRRASFYKDHPPSQIIIIPGKVDFLGIGNPKMEFLWLVWDKQDTGETRVTWHFPKPDQSLLLF